MQCKIIWKTVTNEKLKLHEVAAMLATLGLETTALSIEYENELVENVKTTPSKFNIKRNKSFEKITGVSRQVLDVFQNDLLKILSIKEIYKLIPDVPNDSIRAICAQLTKRQYLKTIERGIYMLDKTE